MNVEVAGPSKHWGKATALAGERILESAERLASAIVLTAQPNVQDCAGGQGWHLGCTAETGKRWLVFVGLGAAEVMKQPRSVRRALDESISGAEPRQPPKAKGYAKRPPEQQG